MPWYKDPWCVLMAAIAAPFAAAIVVMTGIMVWLTVVSEVHAL